MRPFFAGLAVAILIAVVAGIGLNAWDLSSAEVFSTEEAQL